MSTSPPPTAQNQDEGQRNQQNEQHIPESDEIKSRLKASYDAIAPRYNAWTTDHSSLRNRYLDKLLEYLLPARGAVDESSDSITHEEAKEKGRVYRVLELGCGAGVPVTERLVEFDFEKELGSGYEGCSFRVIANDLSSTQVGLGRGKLGGRFVLALEDGKLVDFAEEEGGDGGSGNEIKWIQGDMTKLKFLDDSFDAVIAMYSLIHLPREEQEVMIQRIAGWLKRPSGCSPADGGGIMLLNFGDEASEGDVIERWLGEDKGWMYWSGWGAEKTMEIVREKENGLEVLVDEVVSELEEGVDVSFLWVIARRS